MQKDPVSRPRRWPYIALALLIPVLGAGWTATWYYAAGRAGAVIDGWREREARSGRVHRCGSESIGGFPFRFELRCVEPTLEVKTAARQLRFAAKDIVLSAELWQPTRFAGEIVGPLTVSEPGQTGSIVGQWRRASLEMRGLPVAPERGSIAIENPVFERRDGAEAQGLFTAQRLEVVGRMLEGSARQNPVIEVSFKLAAAAAPNLHVLTEQPLDADVTAVLRGLRDFRPKPLPERFREIQASGGNIEIKQAKVRQAETVARASGTLGLTPRGGLDGQLRLEVANLGALMPALGLDRGSQQPAPAGVDRAAERLDRLAPGLGNVARKNAGPALIAGLNFIGRPAEIEGQRALALPLRFKDGVVSLGPIPLGQVAPLY
jgi:hypothetical protein